MSVTQVNSSIPAADLPAAKPFTHQAKALMVASLVSLAALDIIINPVNCFAGCAAATVAQFPEGRKVENLAGLVTGLTVLALNGSAFQSVAIGLITAILARTTQGKNVLNEIESKSQDFVDHLKANKEIYKNKALELFNEAAESDVMQKGARLIGAGISRVDAVLNRAASLIS